MHRPASVRPRWPPVLRSALRDLARPHQAPWRAQVHRCRRRVRARLPRHRCRNVSGRRFPANYPPSAQPASTLRLLGRPQAHGPEGLVLPEPPALPGPPPLAPLMVAHVRRLARARPAPAVLPRPELSRPAPARVPPRLLLDVPALLVPATTPSRLRKGWVSHVARRLPAVARVLPRAQASNNVVPVRQVLVAIGCRAPVGPADCRVRIRQ